MLERTASDSTKFTNLHYPDTWTYAEEEEEEDDDEDECGKLTSQGANTAFLDYPVWQIHS